MSIDFFNGIEGYGAAFRATDITSARMRDAIKDWVNLYYNQGGTEDEDFCQQIPYTIVRKLTKTVFSEYTAACSDEFAAGILSALEGASAEAMQMALIGGECLLRPMPTADGFYFSVVPRHNVRVFGRDAFGRLTDIGMDSKTIHDKYYYTLLERRKVDAAGYLTIENKLYRSMDAKNLGTQVPLDSLELYAQLQDVYTYAKPIGSIGLVQFKTPIANCVDGSPDGVSVYAAAVGLIHNINRNEAQLNGEFSRGESRIIASDDMIHKRNGYGGIERELKSHLFVGLDGDPDDVGISIFSPAIREQSFLARKQEYLRNVENIIGLKRGLLSEVEAAERTATEITSSAGEYNLTIIDFQRMWETVVRDAVKLCGILGQAYRVSGAHDVNDKDIVINWGNGVLYDEEKTNAELLSQVNTGLLQPERYLGWYHNLPCDTPREREKIRKDYMPERPEEDGE